MSTITPPGQGPLPSYVPKLFTVADLAVLPSQLPSGPVLYELHHGRLITLPPPGDVHGAVEGNLIAALKVQGEFRGLGKARCGDVGIVLARNPDHVLGADAVFIANASLPIRRSPEGYLETIPELVVEVRSKNDSLPELQRKAQEYLDAGTRVVWVADPIARNVTEYRKDTPPRVYAEDDTLGVEDLIPGFGLSVRGALEE
jgi:Uma2 family endonuclease